MVKWHKIVEEWERKKPKFFSLCNLYHRFKYWHADGDPWWAWHKTMFICRKCRCWWEV